MEIVLTAARFVKYGLCPMLALCVGLVGCEDGGDTNSVGGTALEPSATVNGGMGPSAGGADAESTSCTLDMGCEPGEVCDLTTGVCMPSCGPGGACDERDECVDGQFCRPLTTCDDNNSCGAGRICDCRGLCAAVVGQACVPSKPLTCPPDAYCNPCTSTCTPKGEPCAPCAEDDHCKGRDICILARSEMMSQSEIICLYIIVINNFIASFLGDRMNGK